MPADLEALSRRKFAILSSAALAGVAGCLDDDDEDSDGSGDDGNETDGDEDGNGDSDNGNEPEPNWMELTAVDLESGEPVPEASITVDGEPLDEPRTATTDEDGVAVIEGLDPAQYAIEATADGYAPAQGGLEVKDFPDQYQMDLSLPPAEE